MKSQANNSDHVLNEVEQRVDEKATDASAEGEHSDPGFSSEMRRNLILDNFELEALEKELNDYSRLSSVVLSYWDDPTFLELVNDRAFRARLHSICRRVLSQQKPLHDYDADDLDQDVLLNLRNWSPRIPGDRPSQALLWRIAFNQLVSVHRLPAEQCESVEELDLDQLPSQRQSDNFVARLQGDIHMRELYLSLKRPTDREAFLEYFVKQMKPSEIARAHGISRQAATKRIDRLLDHLKI